MSNHTMKYLRVESKGVLYHAARCRCGWYSGNLDRPQQVEDEVSKHESEIEKVRAYLGSRNPSLKQQRDYFRSKEQDHNTDPKDRPLWRQLADELDHRLNDTSTQTEQDQLPLG